MKMTRDQLARVARNLRATMDASIGDVKNLKRLVGRPLGDEVDEKHAGEEYVQVEAHPQRPDAFVLRYFRRTGQSPIMAIVNPAAGSIKVMLTCVEQIDGYAVFEEDEFGLMQDKELPGLDFALLRAELEDLASGKGSDSGAKGAETGARFSINPLNAQILCSVCGKGAARFKVGMYPGDTDHFVYFDMQDKQQGTFSASDTEEMWKFVKTQDLRGLQAYLLAEIPARPVLDAYCAECDAAYCVQHHGARDGSVCPQGHRKGSAGSTPAPKRAGAPKPAPAKKPKKKR